MPEVRNRTAHTDSNQTRWNVSLVRETTGGQMKRCCDLIYWKHDDGWDVYHRSECQPINGTWVPNWFDNFVIEDAPTKAAAKAEIASRHILGLCLVKS